MTTTTVDAENTPDAPRQMTLPELRKYEGQLFIQNNTPNQITFHERLGEKWVDFELDPAGEPDSLAFLPKLALDMRGLQKLWMRGSITISSDPEMEDQIMLLNAKAVGASDERMREIMGQQTENASHRDITENLCLVCGKRNAETSVVERGRVLQSRREIKDGVPPLCPEHVHQAHNFVPRVVSEKGVEHWEFDAVHMTATQR